MSTSEKTPPRAIPFGNLSFSPRFAYGEQAAITEVTGTTDGTRLGSGFARFTNACIPWTVKYDEVLLVLEGSVSIRTGNDVLTANARDCVWLPRNTELQYESESALVFYAIEPSNWSEQA